MKKSNRPLTALALAASLTLGAGLASAQPGDVAPLNGDGSMGDTLITASDAVGVLRMVLGLRDDNMEGDVAPFEAPDGQVTASDAVTILRAVLGVHDSAALVSSASTSASGLTFTGIGPTDSSTSSTAVQTFDSPVQQLRAAPTAPRGLSGSSTASDDGLLHYQIVNPDAARAEGDSLGTNLWAFDFDTNGMVIPDSGRFLINSTDTVMVMFTASSPGIEVADADNVTSGEYMYVALDFDASKDAIAKEDCAIFRVERLTSTHTCVKENVYLSPIDDNYRRKLGNLKPLQFDESGTLYFNAKKFESDGNGNVVKSSNTLNSLYIYNHGSTEQATEFTNNAQDVEFHLVLPTGGFVYQAYNNATIPESRSLQYVVMENGNYVREIELSDVEPALFNRDTYQAVYWRGQTDSGADGIWIARPNASGTVDKALLHTSRTNRIDLATGLLESAETRQIVMADDFSTYALYHTDGSTEDVVVNQLLPFVNTPKATFEHPGNTSKSLRFDLPIQVSKGYLFSVDKHDMGGGLGKTDFIRKIYLPNGRSELLLDKDRFELYSWKVSGSKLYFSGVNKESTSVASRTISGVIDINKVRQGRPQEEYLTVEPVASALGAAAIVRDMEIITPVTPENDPGGKFRGKVVASVDNPNSVSVEFSKYADEASVESDDVFSFTNSSNSTAVPHLKVWTYQHLHVIPDTDTQGVLDASSTTPLPAGTYNLTIAGEDGGGSFATDTWQSFGLEPDPDQTQNGVIGVNVDFTIGDPPTITNDRPTALFGVTNADAVYTFTDQSTDDQSVVSWDWSITTPGEEGPVEVDPAVGDTQNSGYTFTESGTYQVSLTVADASGLTDTKIESITVEVLPPEPPPAPDLPEPLGDVSFALTWTWTDSTYAQGPDIDLWVEDPNNERLHSSRGYYSLGPTPTNGGLIDLDDQGGTGPGDGGGAERAYWPENRAPAGDYTFGVRYFAGNGTANYTITIYKGAEIVATETGSVSAPSSEDAAEVFTYTNVNSSSVVGNSETDQNNRMRNARIVPAKGNVE